MATIKYWNGSAWELAIVGKQGPAGPSGPTGPTGPTGATGATGAIVADDDQNIIANQVFG